MSIKYTKAGLEARRNALLHGTKVKPKSFKISDKAIDINRDDLNDLPDSWIEKDIYGFRAISDTTVELELRVEKKEAINEGRSFCIYLDDGTPYIIGVPSNTFNRNIEQRFLVAIELENSIDELDYVYIQNLENNNVVWTGEDISTDSALVHIEMIDTYSGYKNGDTFVFRPIHSGVSKFKVLDLDEKELVGSIQSGKIYIAFYKNGRFEAFEVGADINEKVIESLVDNWNSILVLQLNEIERIVNDGEFKELKEKIENFEEKFDNRLVSKEKEILEDIENIADFKINSLGLDLERERILGSILSLWNLNLSLQYKNITDIVENKNEELVDDKLNMLRDELNNRFDKKIENIIDNIYSKEDKTILNVFENITKTNYLYIKGEIDE